MKLEEIAQLAGVSRTTASYVINGKAKHYRVSDKTIQKVMAVVKKYNYQPNAVAAGLRAGKTYSIGLIIPDLENISYTRIANHLEHKVRKAGYQLLISCSEDNPEIEKKCVFHLKQRHADAIIVSSSFISEHSFYDNWDNSNIPILALDRPLPVTKFRSILGDDKADSETLASEFSKFIADNIVYIGALPNLSNSQHRERGFKKGINGSDKKITYLYAKDYSRDAAIELFSQHRERGFKKGINGSDKKITYLYAKDYSRDAAIELFSDWLVDNPIPLSLFVTSFSLLQGVIDAILARVGALPKNMVIATFGDNELLDFLPCKIISLAQNHKYIAEITVDTLLHSLSNQNAYQPGHTEIKRNLNYRGRLNQKLGVLNAENKM